MTQPGSPSPPLDLTDRLVWTALFSFILVLTLVVGGVFAAVAVREGKTYAWKRTDCVILQSQVDEPGPYRGLSFVLRVQYEYVWKGRTYRAERFSDGAAAFSDYRQAHRWRERLPEGRRTTCFVNPFDPAGAVLSHVGVWPSQLFGVIALVPLTIAAVMVGLLSWVWRRPQLPPAPQESLTLRFLSKVRRGLDSGMAVLVGSSFLLAGSVFFYFEVAKPFLQSLMARSWTPTPCRVLSSGVFKGKAFHLYVLYAYEFKGAEYKSSRGHFRQIGSSDGRGKKAFVARHPAGHKAVCYVNSKDPTEAVLDRGMNREGLRSGWVGLHFVVIGAAFLAFRHTRRKTISRVQFFLWSLFRHTRNKPISNRVQFFLCSLFHHARNKPITKRVQFFLWSLAAATISNEVVGVFAWQRVIPAWRRGGRVSIGLIGLIGDTAIMVVFGIMGLISLMLFLVALMGLFKPRQKGGRKRAVSKAPSPATAEAAVPYGIDQRPMPTGEDLDRLLPRQVGAFTRTELPRPKDLRRDPIYAQYRKDKVEVFVELGICGDARGAQEALATAKAETEVEPGDAIQACSEGTEPSFLKTVSPTLGAFLAWTRGGYYLSAYAKGGEGDLESFVREFPH